MSPRFHTLTVADVRRETPDAVSVAFEVPPALGDDYRFAQGQYVTLRARVGGEECRRSYSICSGLDDGELRVAVKEVEGGRLSTFVNRELRPGDRLDVMTPMGRFTVPLDPTAARAYLAIAAGSGITPILSIVKTVLTREPQSQVLLLYGNRSSDRISFRSELEDLKDRFVGRLTVLHVLSREVLDVPLLNGRIDRAKIDAVLDRVLPLRAIDHVFLCGPFGLIDEARAALEARGLPHERLHVELFTPADDAHRPAAAVVGAHPAGAPANVDHAAEAELLLGGRRHKVGLLAGETVIDAAHRVGVEAPYSCKGGMCCTCRAKLVEGEVEMATNYSLEPWELEAGFVLTCQARAVTDRLVVDYDAL
jgi:ring-1,2-phenylacetyl-CoA epoxidase subunit PaaE